MTIPIPDREVDTVTPSPSLGVKGARRDLQPTSTLPGTPRQVAQASQQVMDMTRVEATRQRRVRRRERWLAVLTPIVILAVWEFVARMGWSDTRFFPGPSTIVRISYKQLITTGDILMHLRASMGRIALGFILGALPGIVVGVLMGGNRFVRASLYPLVVALYPIPKLAILPFLLLIFGLGETSKIVLIAIGVFFIVVFNTLSGVVTTPRIYFEVGRDSGARGWRLFLTVALPGAAPAIFTGLRVGMGIALLLIVAAEFVGAKQGVGYLVWWSWETFQIETMYAGLVILAILGFAATTAIDLLERYLIPWADTSRER